MQCLLISLANSLRYATFAINVYAAPDDADDCALEDEQPLSVTASHLLDCVDHMPKEQDHQLVGVEQDID